MVGAAMFRHRDTCVATKCMLGDVTVQQPAEQAAWALVIAVAHEVG